MSHALTLELPQDVYQPLVDRAAAEQQSPEDWLLTLLRQQFIHESGQANGGQSPDYQLRQLFGSVSLGAPTGMDNEQIDADLARAYGADD